MLWPLLIVAFGLSLLSIRNLAWKITSLSLVVLTVGFVAYVALGDYKAPITLKSYETSTSLVSSEIKSAQVIVKAGASKINIDSADQTEVVKAKLESNVAQLSEKSSRDGTKQTVELTMDTVRHWWFGNTKNNFGVTLGRTLLTDFSMDFGAADATIDLSQVKAENIVIKTGASSTDLRLGSAVKTTNLSLESGASSAIIRVPSGSGVRLDIDSGLTSTHLADLEDKGDGIHESPGFADATNTITITAKLGAASFTIERY